MQHRPSSEANSSTVVEKFPTVYGIRNRQPFAHIQTQMHLIHAITSHLFIDTYEYYPPIYVWTISFIFPLQTPVKISLLFQCATCIANLPSLI
jgi:hypothetical protein